MSHIGHRFLSCIRSYKVGLSLFGVVAIATAGTVFNPLVATNVNGHTEPNINQQPIQKVSQAVNADQVKLSGKLSQTKMVQGGPGEVYMTVTIDSPENKSPNGTEVRGTDLVVVLDRSGSMSAPEKLPYAKQAVKELVAKMSDRDRFALVQFSDYAQTVFPLSPITPNSKSQVDAIINGLSASGGTNIHDGVSQAWEIIGDNTSSRMRKVILLSDGEATSGDTSVSGLRNISALARQQEAALSTIGMGLGFNEVVMSSMADHGMGSFFYLETLQQLGIILAKDFQDAQQTFAATSSINIKLPEGIELVDAAGYPMQRNGQRVSVAIGGLLSGATKQFILTFKVPNQHVAQYDLSDLQLEYKANGELARVHLPKESLYLAMVEPERREEAVASIDEASYSSVWKNNNVARMRYSVNEHLRKGEKNKAKEVISDYREQVKEMEEESGLSLYQTVSAELDVIDAALDDAFSGSVAEQKVKQNRLAKKSHADILNSQRKFK